jgi:formate-dependent nitrite reductase cytochrome c552 subunit
MSTLTLKNGTAIPIEQSAPLCAQCHKDIYQAWRDGKHGILAVNCAKCHNPHLKASPTVTSENPSQLKLITLMLSAVGMSLGASLATVLVTLKLREK